MQDLDLADPELVLIINITENKVCNDCQKKNPRWCSINNAVLLCASCARNHRKFNEYISKIKSLEGDLWTKDEIKRLYIGGNDRFNKLLKSYNIPLTNDNAEYKYHTKIAGYYRDLLSEELKGKKVIDLVRPSLKEGIELLSKEEYDKLNQYVPSQDNILQNNNNNNISNSNNNSSDVLNIPKSNNNIYANPFASEINNNNNSNNNFNNRNNFNNNRREDTFEQHLNDFADTMGTVFNNISQKAQSIDYNEKLKNAGEYIKDKKEKIENSETFKGFMSALSTGIDNLVRKTEDLFNDSLDSNLYQVNNEQRRNVNRSNNRNQNQFNFQGQRINNNNFNNNNNNLNKNNSNYKPINNNMKNNVPLNNMNNNNVQNNMNNNIHENNMSNNNVVQNQNNINNNGNNNNSNNINSNNVNINIEDIDTPDGDDDIPKLIYNNSPQNLNIQGEQNNNNNNNNVASLDGINNEKNDNDNNTESLDGNNK